VIGNEFANAIAKHAALHNYGHDEAFPPPSSDSNPFAHLYWLAEENNETTHTTIKINLAPLQNIEDRLKAQMSKHRRLGDANTNSDYYNFWKRLLTSVNLTTSNFSSWSNTRINVSQKRNVMKFRTKRNSDYYNFWKRLLTSVNLTTSNFPSWSNTRINVSQKRNVMKFRTGTLNIQEMAQRQSH